MNLINLDMTSSSPYKVWDLEYKQKLSLTWLLTNLHFFPRILWLKDYFREHRVEKLILEHKPKGLVLVLTFSRYGIFSKTLYLNGPQIPHLQMVVGGEIWRRLGTYAAVISPSSW